MPDIEIELYDAGAIEEKTGEHSLGDLISSSEIVSSNSEPSRRKILNELRSHPLGAKRKLTIGSQAIVERIEALAEVAPHFGETLGLIRRAALLSMRTGVGLTIPPLLLVSEPGLGKTWLARRLGEAIGVPMGEYSFASGDDPGVLTGHSLSWRGARMGLVAKTLLFGDYANPVVFIDELDKAMSLNGEDPTDCLHALLEPENARRYADQFLELPIRADHVIWLLTANFVDNLRPSLVDRTIVMRIDRLTGDQQRRVLASIIDEAFTPYAAAGPSVTNEAFNQLSECSPRLAKRIVSLALGYAVAAGRFTVEAVDIDRARRVVGGRPERRPAGFHSF